MDSVLDPSLLKIPVGFGRLWIGLHIWGGVGVRSRVPRVPWAVREPGPVERLEEVTEGQIWCPRGHGPCSLTLPHDPAAESPSLCAGGNVWLYCHHCPLMCIRYGLITIYKIYVLFIYTYLYKKKPKSGMRQGYWKCNFQLHQWHTPHFAGNWPVCGGVRWDSCAQLLQEAGAKQGERQQGERQQGSHWGCVHPCSEAVALSPPALAPAIPAKGVRKGKWRVSLTPVISSCHRASREAPVASTD